VPYRAQKEIACAPEADAATARKLAHAAPAVGASKVTGAAVGGTTLVAAWAGPTDAIAHATAIAPPATVRRRDLIARISPLFDISRALSANLDE
jgi:hypothetical protein